MATEARQRVTENIKEKNKEEPAGKDVEESHGYWDPLTEGVRWVENYADTIEKFFNKIPDFIGTFVATLAVFTLGSTLRGEWVVILVSALKQFSGQTQAERNMTTEEIYKLFTLENLKMEHFSLIFISAHMVSYGTYFLIGGFLHWYFYLRRRHLAHEWKIQPTKWLTPELERHEILLGTMSLFFTGSFSAMLATYILNGNPSTVYFQFDEYGWWWFFLQFPVIFIYKDYTTYILHRLYHTRFLYKHFHKLHHKYKQPTAFAVTAIHPVEIMHIQLTMALPLFLFNVHWFPFFAVAMYNYYHGIIDHSGIHFSTQWWQPWQPPSEFHDLHHLFFHCNFGFNMSLWDKLHGTMRKDKCVYTEETFVGEAPAIDSEEGKKIIAADEDVRDFVEKQGLLSTK